jgi:ribonuclease HI
VNLVLTTNQGI